MADPIIIPTDIVCDILKRLPVKDLLRFKCVSKGWFSQINDPFFITHHTNRSTVNIILNDLDSGKLFCAGFDNFVNLDYPRELNHPIKRILSDECTSEGSASEYTEIVGSCNGLIFLVNETCKTKIMVLWNMSTGDYKVLPDLPVVGDYKVSTGKTKRSRCKTFYGFGYDSITDDYKVVRIVQQRMDISEVRVYSLKANTWRSWSEEKIPDDYCLYPFTGKRDATFLNGALHWVVGRKEDNMTCIMALDVGTEEYDEIEILEYIKGASLCHRLYLGVLGGCLCMLSWCASGLYDELWMMKDYGVEESWTCLFRVKNDEYGLPYKLFPLAYSKDYDKILLASYWYAIEDDDDVPASPKLNKLSRDDKFVCIPQWKNMEYFLCDICVGSLVQLGD